MSSSVGMIRAIAGFFIVLGVVWFVLIQARCNEISPRPTLTKATSNVGASSGSTEKEVKMIRSPYAKDYHFILFWAIAGIEVFVALFYILAGIFLLKRYSLGPFVVAGVLTLDVVFKLLVIFYMQFCAIPLSHLTKNANVLQLYFMPSDKIHAGFSSIASGLQIFLPAGIIFLGVYILYFGFCFLFFNRPEIKKYLKTN